MPAEVEPRVDRHTRSMLTDHMVFTPKYRGKVLVGDVAESLENILLDICREMDIKVMDLAVNPDHVHIFIQYPPKYSVSDIAARLKGLSSKRLREEYPELKDWCPKGLWGPSCFHGSVGHGVDVVRAYIQGQEEHHK